MTKKHEEKMAELDREQHIARLKMAGGILALAVEISAAGGMPPSAPTENAQQDSRVVRVLTPEQEMQVRSPVTLPGYPDFSKTTGPANAYCVSFHGSDGFNERVDVCIRPDQGLQPHLLVPLRAGTKASTPSIEVSSTLSREQAPSTLLLERQQIIESLTSYIGNNPEQLTKIEEWFGRVERVTITHATPAEIPTGPESPESGKP
jgi:hypothetical protein